MPFFLPGRLIEFEYFGNEEPDPEYEEMAEPYRKDIDFAFFAVNLGYSKSDYEALTPRERAFIYKAWENRCISQDLSIYNAVYAATYNVHRSKRKKAVKPVHKRKKKAYLSKEQAEDSLDLIERTEAKEGKGWVDLIYAKNGLTSPERRGKDG